MNNKNNYIITFIWILWFLYAYLTINLMMEKHWFNWLFLLFSPQLWGLFIWPILIIIWIIWTIKNILIYKYNINKEKVDFYKNLFLFMIFLIISILTKDLDIINQIFWTFMVIYLIKLIISYLDYIKNFKNKLKNTND